MSLSHLNFRWRSPLHEPKFNSMWQGRIYKLLDFKRRKGQKRWGSMRIQLSAFGPSVHEKSPFMLSLGVKKLCQVARVPATYTQVYWTPPLPTKIEGMRLGVGSSSKNSSLPHWMLLVSSGWQWHENKYTRAQNQLLSEPESLGSFPTPPVRIPRKNWRVDWERPGQHWQM